MPSFVAAVYCDAPPAKPRGGSMIWNGKTAYETKVDYSCGPFAKFVNRDTGQKYDYASMECLWNKTWNNLLNDRCVWSHCNLIPEPPMETKLKFVPETGTDLPLSTDHAKYNWSIPGQVQIPYSFGRSSWLLLDGSIDDIFDIDDQPTFDVGDLPTIELFDDANAQVIKLVIEPSYSVLQVTSPLTPARDSEFSVTVDFGDPFMLQHTVPVNASLTFACPEGHVFSHNWYLKPQAKIRCFDDGQFNPPSTWPICVE
ncbi:hypothetical protein TCAL_16418, partial [Tigriopus californicus]